MTEKQKAFLEFLKLFPEPECVPTDFKELSFPKPLVTALEYMTEKDFGSKQLEKTEKSTAWVGYNKVLKVALSELGDLTKEFQEKPISASPLKITKNKAEEDIEAYIIMLIILAVHCGKKREIIGKIKTLPKEFSNIIVGVIKEYGKTPAKQEQPKEEAAPQKVEEKKEEKPKVDEDEEAKKQLEEKQKENEKLEKEIEEMKSKIEEAKKLKEESSANEQNSINAIAEINAELFQIKIQNDAKQQKVNRFKTNIENINKLKEECEELKRKLADMQHEISNASSDETIINNLNRKLQTLNLDSQNDKVSGVEEEIKKYAKVINKLKQYCSLYQNRIAGKQNIASLQERLAFVKKLEETNIQRKRRAELALLLNMKNLRCDAFQKEMRSVI